MTSVPTTGNIGTSYVDYRYQIGLSANRSYSLVRRRKATSMRPTRDRSRSVGPGGLGALSPDSSVAEARRG